MGHLGQGNCFKNQHRKIINKKMAKKKTLQELKEIIEREKDFIGIKPYSHNIISLVLLQISKEYSRKEANKCIDEFELGRHGWKKEKSEARDL